MTYKSLDPETVIIEPDKTLTRGIPVATLKLSKRQATAGIPQAEQKRESRQKRHLQLLDGAVQLQDDDSFVVDASGAHTCYQCDDVFRTGGLLK